MLGFTVPARSARGRVVRMGPVLDTILSAHAYPTALRHLLAEALTLTVLMGSLLKDENSQLTIQAQTQAGVVDLLVCDYRGGEVRGYVRHDEERLVALGSNPTLEALFGSGYLAVTFDLADTGQRYQGIVPLEGSSISAACESYFAQSEQVPTLIRVGVRSDPDGCVAGGLLVQHLPEGEDGRERLHARMDHPDWEHVAALCGSVRHEELVNTALSMEQLVWRLFNHQDEVRATPLPPLRRGCRCSVEYYRSVLARFPQSDLVEMRDDDGNIVVDCAFCSRFFTIDI